MNSLFHRLYFSENFLKTSLSFLKNEHLFRHKCIHEKAMLRSLAFIQYRNTFFYCKFAKKKRIDIGVPNLWINISLLWENCRPLLSRYWICCGFIPLFEYFFILTETFCCDLSHIMSNTSSDVFNLVFPSHFHAPALWTIRPGLWGGSWMSICCLLFFRDSFVWGVE